MNSFLIGSEKMQLFRIQWWLLLTFCTAITGTKTDISCLKSIQDSLEDPFGKLSSSWNWSVGRDLGDWYLCAFQGVECWNDMGGKVLNLELSNMGLKGQFPKGIENCKSITDLSLSNNELQGPIPSDISTRLQFLTTLDLSSNKFTGNIPSDIANCSYLSLLNLANNSLTGHIPPEIGLLSRIKTFSVTNNMLSGPVPVFANATIAAENYANNLGLCGGPLERCTEEDHPGKFDYSFKSGFVIAYVAFVISTIVVHASYGVPWLPMGKSNDMITVPQLVMLMIQREKNQPDFDQFNSLSTLEFLLENEISTSEKFITRMRFKDLLKANNIIGSGERGTIYMATLPNGWSLAVKKFCNSQHSEDQFITELKILGKLRHYNIIPLIGFCKESTKRLLVYNYASKGNLSDWLHSGDGEKKNVLKWPMRMKIAVGLARGLAWLHHCCDFRVAHLNVSSKCILLVNPNEVNNSSRVFVMDMEFWDQCFVKEDVFNFGVVLLELITGHKVTSLDIAGISFDASTSGASSKCCEYDAMDELLIGEGYEDEVAECIRIAYKCVEPFPEQRPSMLDVYTRISIIRDRFGH